MHHVPPFESAVTLFSRNGEVEVFRTFKAALKATTAAATSAAGEVGVPV